MTTQRFQSAGGFTPLEGGALVATVAVPSIPGASTAILGTEPLDKARMTSSVEAVAYEFATLIHVAAFGSLLPTGYVHRSACIPPVQPASVIYGWGLRFRRHFCLWGVRREVIDDL